MGFIVAGNLCESGRVSEPANITLEGAIIRVAIVGERPCGRLSGILSATGCLELVAPSAILESPRRTAGGGVSVIIYDLAGDRDTAPFGNIQGLAERCSTLVISDVCNPTDAVSALRVGASGYVTWGKPEATIVASILSGGGAESSESAAGLPGLQQGGTSRSHDAQRLSRREREALKYIAHGFTHQQAARRMGVSKTTVDTYITRARAKLRAGNKAELTALTLSLKL